MCLLDSGCSLFLKTKIFTLSLAFYVVVHISLILLNFNIFTSHALKSSLLPLVPSLFRHVVLEIPKISSKYFRGFFYVNRVWVNCSNK